MEDSSQQIRMAIIYNFDEVLTTEEITNIDFFTPLGIKAPGFWCEVERISNQNKMDSELAFMYLLLEKAKSSNKNLIKEELIAYGKNIKLNDGLDSWFDRINNYAKCKDLIISHYILSNTLKEFIQGSSIASHINAIFANEYMYDMEHKAIWPALCVNYINKSQFFWRVNKGVIDINRQRGVNKYISTSKTAVPLNNIIFLGDVISDVPLLKTVQTFGGYTLGIYNTPLNTSLAKSLEQAKRISYAAPKDFTENSQTENFIKQIIDEISAKGTVDEQY